MFSLRMTAVIIITALLPLAGNAMVDMKNANYTDSWLDLTLTGTGYALRVERTYNSRSVFNGIFGFGWCSDFETVVEKLPEGRLKLTECGAGQEVFFTPSKYDPAALDRIADQIIAHYKKKNPQASADTLNTLRFQVRGSDVVRADFARDAGISVPEAQKGMTYSADNLSVEQIVFDGTTFTRTLGDGTLQKFDAVGHLTAIYDKNGNYLKLTYNGNQIREVIDNTGKKLSFAFNPNHRVKEIVGPGNIKTDYKYKGEDLAEVKNMWKNSYTYQYDETHNLTRINFPDGTFKALSYNTKKDWVTSFTDRASGGVGCIETYQYEVDKENQKGHFWSVATKKCGAEIVNESRYDFYHKELPNGRRYLSRVVTKSPTDSTDVTYHPVFGRPLAIKKNGVTTTFEYFDSGLVKEKTTTVSKMKFEYKNQWNKVSRVIADFFDDKGKVVKTNGEINKVESSDGPTVAVQIASTFNNLLDIIAPATSELSL
jgi:YD repeat-containing protein